MTTTEQEMKLWCKECPLYCEDYNSLKEHIVTCHENKKSMQDRQKPSKKGIIINTVNVKQLPKNSKKIFNYTCEFCAKPFKLRRKLWNHMSLIHDNYFKVETTKDTIIGPPSIQGSYEEPNLEYIKGIPDHQPDSENSHIEWDNFEDIKPDHKVLSTSSNLEKLGDETRDLKPMAYLSYITKNGVKRTRPRKYKKKDKSIPQCMFCNEVFKKRSKLKVHMISHLTMDTSVKDLVEFIAKDCFKCIECQREFRSKSNAVDHIKLIHINIGGVNERTRQYVPTRIKLPSDLPPKKIIPYVYKRNEHVCVVCGKIFSLKNNFVRHTSTVHNGKVYKCAPCDKIYTDQSGLRRHNISKHQG